MFATTFILLYVGHLLADYPLQTDHQAACKADRSAAGWRANVAHAGTHVLACAVALAVGAVVLGERPSVLASAAALAWIGITHAVIDRRWPVRWWMRVARQERFAQHGGTAHVDQTAHITAIAIAALAITA